MAFFEVCVNSYPIKETITYSDAIHHLQKFSEVHELILVYIGADMLQENWVMCKDGFTVHRASIATY